MATTFKQVVNTASPGAITVTGLATLASASYATSNAVNNTTNQPLDLLVELAVTPAAGTTVNGRQAVLFALASLDGVNYQTGANATDEADMTLIGVVPLLSSATQQRRQFSVAQAFGGVLPPYVKFVVKNDCGFAFTAGTLTAAEVSGTAA